MSKPSLSYKDAGVDINAGNELVERIKPHVKRTTRPEVIGGLGGFGALCAIPGKYKEPILVSGTDGVGTKLRLAIDLKKHDTIGIDLVAMCVNDLVVQGAEPLFFLDYYATGKLDVDVASDVVKGIAEGCVQSGCALVGGETAEMAGFYDNDDYDVAGFAVGIVDRPKLITGESIKAGDVILGLPSSGVHSNGFSLVRKIVFDHKQLSIDTEIPEFGKTLGEELLTPTRLYPKAVLPLIEQELVKGMVHITGGGFYENIPRVLPKGVTAEVDVTTWPRLPVFTKLQEWGNVAWPEMYRTFNMGIGMILIVDENDVETVKENLGNRSEAVYEIGRIVSGEGPVVLKGAEFDA